MNSTMMYRHEVKHEISMQDLLILRQRLGTVMKPDSHAINGRYEIRSLYFDTPDDKALREKINGVRVREKYRIRFYNGDTSRICLERKYKNGGLGYKSSALITREEAERIALGDAEFLRNSENEFLRDFYRLEMTERLAPKVIVDYTREPFVLAPGNVRVTLDYNIRTGMNCRDFLKPDCVTLPVYGAPAILEVKWDEFLPDVVRNAVLLDFRRSGAFSKYAACRMYE